MKKFPCRNDHSHSSINDEFHSSKSGSVKRVKYDRKFPVNIPGCDIAIDVLVFVNKREILN